MSRNGTLLPIPDTDQRFAVMQELWPTWERLGVLRTSWLREFENLLREHYPASSSADRKLTARHAAPFPLALGPNVV